MSEVAIWQPGEVAMPAGLPNAQLDDWIMVADKVVRLAEVICRSPFVPDGLRGSVPATAAAILTGRELGIPPMTSLANIHVIHGKPGLSALVMRALVMREGHEWQDVDVSNTRVVLKGRRKGEADWTEASFSTADANIAKLQLGGYPQDKLYARASARLARRKFADVIAGMPYSIEELEDGASDEDTPAAEATAPAPVQPAPAPRTAQRKPRAQTAPSAQPSPPASAAHPPSTADAGGALPPLPGEEEDPTTSGASSSAHAPDGASRQRTGAQSPSTSDGSATTPDDTDYDTPGTATTPQKTALWTVLSNVFKFSSDEKDQARAVCAHIAGRDLASSSELSKNEAKAVLDTLSHWQHQAGERGEHPRDYLIAMMVAQDAADGEVPGE